MQFPGIVFGSQANRHAFIPDQRCKLQAGCQTATCALDSGAKFVVAFAQACPLAKTLMNTEYATYARYTNVVYQPNVAEMRYILCGSGPT